MVSIQQSSRRFLFNLSVRIKQIAWKRRISSPYLSSDLFVSLCDFAYLKPDRLSSKKLSQLSVAKAIFCRSDLLNDFISTYGVFIGAKILVCGQSDYDFHETPKNLPSSLNAIFLQNSLVSDNTFVFTLPIGLENVSLGINGHPNLLRQISPNSESEGKILAGPYAPTHPVRLKFRELFPNSSGNIVVVNERLFPKSYSRVASKYQYVLALRGNGIDTHRFWETLYRGGVPIVEKSSWSASLAFYGIPLIQIANLNYDLIMESVMKFESKVKSPENIPALWRNFWEELFDSKIRNV